jgi:hypothetical protein
MKYFKTYEAYRRGVNGVGSLKNSLAALKRQNITGRYTDAETLAKGIRNEYEAITGEKYEDEVQMSMDDAIADIIGHFKLDGPEFMAAWDKVVKESVNEAKLKRGDKITIEFDDEDGDYKAGEYTVIGGSKGGKELEGMGIKIFMTDRELNSIEYTVKESYDGTLSDIKYDLEMALDNLGINSKALKGVKKTPKGYEVRMSSYMSDKNTWDRIGTDIGADLIDFKKGSINIGIYEKVNLKADHLSSAEYQKAKKLKDFNKDDWSWNGDTQLYDRVNEAYIGPLYDRVNEGQFSWMTQDTGEQIGSQRENRITVYMYDNEGNRWEEKRYKGYGNFGGMDYYELLDKMNGGEGDRGAGIELAFDKKKVKAGKVLFPALVTDPRYNWKRHNFKVEAKHDPNQSWL